MDRDNRDAKRRRALGHAASAVQWVRSEKRRNPDWTEEETLLALEAYFRLRPRYPRADDEVIEELSSLLRSYALQRGVTGEVSFRNPHGVSRKVAKFRAAERGRPPSDVRGADLEAEVWARYHGDAAEVSAAAAELRRRIYQADADAPVLFDPRNPLLALELSKVVDPRSQGGFLRTAGLDALSAGMRNAGGGLFKEQRIRWVLGIHQHDQRFPECFDPVGGIALLGELKAGGRGHAIGVVAAAASGFFEDGVEGFGERGRLGSHRNRRGHTYEYPDQRPTQSGPIISPSRSGHACPV